MSLKQVVSIAGNGDLETEQSKAELREFYSDIDLETMERLLFECFSKDKKDKFDTRGFAFQDLINEIGTRLGYDVTHGLYRERKNEVGFDGLWKDKDGYSIIMEAKTNDDYSISIESVTGYRDKLIFDHKVPKKKCSVLIVYGRDDKNALHNTVKGSDEAKSIRLISATALFQLLKIKEDRKSDTVQMQIYHMLRPKDYFVLDNLVELVFPETDPEIPDVEDVDEPVDKAEEAVDKGSESVHNGGLVLVWNDYKDQHFEGTYNPETMKVNYKGVDYSPSRAEVCAIQDTGSGRKTENGWHWWKYKDHDGNIHMLRDLKHQEDDHGVE